MSVLIYDAQKDVNNKERQALCVFLTYQIERAKVFITSLRMRCIYDYIKSQRAIQNGGLGDGKRI